MITMRRHELLDQCAKFAETALLPLLESRQEIPEANLWGSGHLQVIGARKLQAPP